MINVIRFLGIVSILSTLLTACSKDTKELLMEDSSPTNSDSTTSNLTPPLDNSFITNTYTISTIGKTTLAVRKEFEKNAKYTQGLDRIKKDIESLNHLVPQKTLSLWATDTIWVDTAETTIFYQKSNLKNNLSAKIIISNPSTYLQKVTDIHPAYLLHHIALLHFDKYLGINSKNDFTKHYYSIKAQKYTSVYKTNGTKLIQNQKPDASISVEKYFAELSEAYFIENDFYPFDYQDLKRYDNSAFLTLENIYGQRTIVEKNSGIKLPPLTLKQWLANKESDLDLYYSKYIDASGMPIVSSRFVADSALIQAKYIVETMLKRVPDALKIMLSYNFRVGIVGTYENVTDMPENRKMKEWWPGTDWDTRARGYGATAYLPLMTCGEENIIKISNYKELYPTQSIMVHEFAHNIDFGLRKSRSGFERKLLEAFSNAKIKGLWKNTYAMTNDLEYFATGAQAWFDTCNMYVTINNKTVRLKTRKQLQDYDIELYNILNEILPEEKLTGYHFTYE